MNIITIELYMKWLKQSFQILYKKNMFIIKMKYYSVPDQCFTAINREIDKYSSALFMCSTRLLIADGDNC